MEDYLKKLFGKEERKLLPKINDIRKNINSLEYKYLANIENKIKEGNRDKAEDENSIDPTLFEKLDKEAFLNRECAVCTKQFYYGNEFTFDPSVSFYEIDTFSNGKS